MASQVCDWHFLLLAGCHPETAISSWRSHTHPGHLGSRDRAQCSWLFSSKPTETCHLLLLLQGLLWWDHQPSQSISNLNYRGGIASYSQVPPCRLEWRLTGHVTLGGDKLRRQVRLLMFRKAKESIQVCKWSRQNHLDFFVTLDPMMTFWTKRRKLLPMCLPWLMESLVLHNVF